MADMTVVKVDARLLDRASVSIYKKTGKLPKKQDVVKMALEQIARSADKKETKKAS